MKEKYTSPSYQWYPDRFAGSGAVKRMTLEEKGAYRELLDYQWSEGWVPDDIGEIAEILGVSKKKAAQLWVKLGPCFEVEASGRLAAPFLETVRAFAEKQSLNGRRGGRPSKPSGKPNVKPSESQTETQAKAKRKPPNSELPNSELHKAEKNPPLPPLCSCGSGPPASCWKEILSDLSERLDKHTFVTWWRPARLVHQNGTRWDVAVPTKIIGDYLADQAEVMLQAIRKRHPRVQAVHFSEAGWAP